MLTYKRKLILNKSQQSRIDGWLGVCRMVYNLGLEVKIAAWRNLQQSVNKFKLISQIVELKDIDWIADVPASTLENVMFRLDRSYNNFFNGAGFPKWATKRKYNSLSFRYAYVKGNSIRLQKLGFVKMFKDAEIKGNIKQTIVKREAGGYFVCITTDAVKDIQNKDESQVIGLDMGIARFCTDSNGNHIDNPRHFKKYEDKLRVLARSFSRKKIGSNNRKKQGKRLAKLHYQIANVRRDFLQKESTKIAKQNNTVFLEDLNVSGLAKNKGLSKHILDAGWSAFRLMLQYKTNVVAVNPKYTSQTCNSCGEADSKSRISQSEFVCTKCGHVSNADENAAKNILSKGIALVRKREAKA